MLAHILLIAYVLGTCSRSQLALWDAVVDGEVIQDYSDLFVSKPRSSPCSRDFLRAEQRCKERNTQPSVEQSATDRHSAKIPMTSAAEGCSGEPAVHESEIELSALESGDAAERQILHLSKCSAASLRSQHASPQLTGDSGSSSSTVANRRRARRRVRAVASASSAHPSELLAIGISTGDQALDVLVARFTQRVAAMEEQGLLDATTVLDMIVDWLTNTQAPDLNEYANLWKSLQPPTAMNADGNVDMRLDDPERGRFPSAANLARVRVVLRLSNQIPVDRYFARQLQRCLGVAL